MTPQPPFPGSNDPFAKFTDLDTRRKRPALYTVNGIGCRLMGSRDADRETASVVKTHVLTLVFIPVYALGAYRLRDLGGGSYLIFGKVPLSQWVKRLNALVVIVTLSLIGGAVADSYRNSLLYKDGRELAAVEEVLAGGNRAEALERASVALGRRSTQQAALLTIYRTAFDGLMADGTAEERVSAIARAVRDERLRPKPIEDVRGVVMKHVEATAAADPAGAALEMKAVRPAVPAGGEAAFEEKWSTVLEAAVKAQPNHTELATDLALRWERLDRMAEARRLLEPHRAALGGGEGARLLGQLLVGEGDYAAGAPLLEAYVSKQLPTWRKAEQRVGELASQIEENALNALNKNEGPTDFYTRYQAADEAGKRALVDAYVVKRINESRGYADALAALETIGPVVPAALDLGMAQLRNAQAESDPTLRKQGLEKAEQTFLGIRGAAGASADFQLLLGQVYHWMGRREEGDALFEKLLAAPATTLSATGDPAAVSADAAATAAAARHTRMLMVAGIYRQLGESQRTRDITEKVCHETKDSAMQRAAANLRALVFTDLDDRIAWLERCDPADASVKRSLDEARAHKHVEKGEYDQAARLYRSVIAGYDAEARSASSLNNSANIYSSLYYLTRRPEDYREAVNRHEQAMRLAPQDTVLLSNVLQDWPLLAMLDLVEGEFDVERLPTDAAPAAYACLSSNEAEWKEQVRKLTAHPAVRKARTASEQLLVLAPGDASAYAVASSWAELLEDDAAVRTVREKAAAAKPEVESGWTEAKKNWAGERAERRLRAARQGLDQWVDALKKLPAGAMPFSRHLARAKVVDGQLSVANEGGEANLPALVAEAEALVKERPSGSNIVRAAEAHLTALVAEVSAADASFRQWMVERRRSFGIRDAVTLALEGGVAADALRKNAHLAAAVAFYKRHADAYPNRHDAGRWAFARQTRPDAAPALRDALLADAGETDSTELMWMIHPSSVSSVLAMAWLEEARGYGDRARQIREEAKAKGMPLP